MVAVDHLGHFRGDLDPAESRPADGDMQDLVAVFPRLAHFFIDQRFEHAAKVEGTLQVFDAIAEGTQAGNEFEKVGVRAHGDDEVVVGEGLCCRRDGTCFRIVAQRLFLDKRDRRGEAAAPVGQVDRDVVDIEAPCNIAVRLGLQIMVGVVIDQGQLRSRQVGEVLGGTKPAVAAAEDDDTRLRHGVILF